MNKTINIDLSTQLTQWRESGDFVSVTPFNRSVFFRQWGDVNANADETLLLLHGFPESSFSYHKVIDGLSEQFKRVVVFDMLGYGFSDKPSENYSYSLIDQADVASQVWAALGIRGGHVLSHDMGTSVLTELLSRQVMGQLPSRFDKGIVSATFTNGSMVLGMAKLRPMQRLLLGPLGHWFSGRSTYRLFQRSIISAHGASDEKALVEQDVADLWLNYCHSQGHKLGHLLITYLNDRKRFEQGRWLPSLSLASKSIPIHFCWGDADQVARIEMVHYLQNKYCPDAILSVMDGVGHFCQIGSSNIWLKSIRNFYRGL